MPRLIPAEGAAGPHAAGRGRRLPKPSRVPTQAILEYSLRRLGRYDRGASPPALTDRARRLLTDAQGLVTAAARPWPTTRSWRGPPGADRGRPTRWPSTTRRRPP